MEFLVLVWLFSVYLAYRFGYRNGIGATVREIARFVEENPHIFS